MDKITYLLNLLREEGPKRTYFKRMRPLRESLLEGELTKKEYISLIYEEMQLVNLLVHETNLYLNVSLYPRRVEREISIFNRYLNFIKFDLRRIERL